MDGRNSGLIEPEAKPNMVGTFGLRDRVSVPWNGSRNVDDVLNASGIPRSPNSEVLVDGRVASPTDIVPQGAEVTIAERVRGG